MRAFLIAALTMGAAIVVTAPADASQGCGPRAHRGPYGRCVANRPMMRHVRVVRNRQYYQHRQRVQTIRRDR